jgi:glycine cleavage system regulatory protein
MTVEKKVQQPAKVNMANDSFNGVSKIGASFNSAALLQKSFQGVSAMKPKVAPTSQSAAAPTAPAKQTQSSTGSGAGGS